MKSHTLLLTCALILVATFTNMSAQDSHIDSPVDKWHFSLGLQSESYYTTAPTDGSRYHGRHYLSAQVYNKHFTIATRLEEMSHPLPGFEATKGWGIPHFSITSRFKPIEVTLGDLYEQFGSGLLLRSYEERSLGLDNAIRGGRIIVRYRDLLTLKAVGGQQRYHFDRGWHLWSRDRGTVYGGDIDLGFSELIPALSSTLQWRLGGSYVAKYEVEDEITQLRQGRLMALSQPTIVGAWAGRSSLAWRDLNLYIEYARKGSDPSRVNNYIFRPGSVAMLTLSYLWGNNSLFVGARRSENFDFRSARGVSGNDLKVNFLQPFTKQQSYVLPAMYPYATNALGEWSFQGVYALRLPKRSWLGGRYGTQFKLSLSFVQETERIWERPEWAEQPHHPSVMGSDGYQSRFFGMGAPLYQSVDLEVSKKVSPTYSFHLLYAYQLYNQHAIEGHATNGDNIISHIWVYDGKHRISPKVTLRTELQYLTTRQDKGDWCYLLAECSVLPYLLFSISDQWNVGGTKEHFYMGSVAALFGAHRLQLSYGKTREGINCAGGVCRLMPAMEGLFFTYNFEM